MDQQLFIIVVVAYSVMLLLIPAMYMAWSFRVVYLSGYHRLIFTDEDAAISSVLVRIPDGDKEVTLPHGTYSLDNEAVRYMGRFRIPTYEYLKGISEPLIVTPEHYDLSDKTKASDFQRVAKNQAMAQLVAAMRKGVVNPVSMMAIGFVILAIVVIAVGGYQIMELQEISKAVGVPGAR